MKPYYEHAGIIIYHGDCRDVMPTVTCDALVTDPPYGMNLKTDSSRFSGGCRETQARRGQARGRARVHKPARPIFGDREPFDPSPMLACGQDQIIWGWNHFADRLPRGACLVWLKRTDAAFQSFLSDAEVAWFSRGHGVYCRRDLTNLEISAERVHPTQKPLTLMSWCLSFIPKARHILDPYMGSGTTLVAAKNRGLRATGIEIEERYCEAAAKRLSQEVLLFGVQP